MSLGLSQDLFIHIIWATVRKIEADVGMDSLTLRNRNLLDTIGEHDAEPLRVTDLIKLVRGGTPPTIYSGLAELERGGWITRTSDPMDGRAHRLTLTTKSRRTFARMSREILRIDTH